MAPSFAQLGVPETLVQAFEAMGYAEPTPVQAEAIPILLSGSDTIVEAQTGTGKTAAFAVPVVLAGSKARGLRALVLVPTRELARQVAEEIRAVGTGSPFRAVAVTGGVMEEQEERALGGDVRCIVATPGRLLALAEAGKVRLDAVSLVVLDEADRMLDMGFLPDAEKVLDQTPARGQTVLVSATLPDKVVDLARRHLQDVAEVRVLAGAPTPEALSHWRLNVFQEQKEAALVALLRMEDPERAVVFVRTRDRADRFWRLLKAAGFAVDRLQGEMKHDQRRHVFDLFSRGVSRVLVATDLAARGLDVPEMELVVNADLPDDDESYVHRAGRAARMGRPGKVVSMVLPDEKARRVALERAAGVEMAPYRLEFSEKDLPPAWGEEKEAPARRPAPKRPAPKGPPPRPASRPAPKKAAGKEGAARKGAPGKGPRSGKGPRKGGRTR